MTTTKSFEKATLPRELYVVSKTVGPDAVGRYAELTADFNPIHLDPEFAAETVFGRPIIHGTLGLNLVIEAIERTFGTRPENLAIDARFVRPVPVGSTIRAGGHLQDAATGTYEIYVETQAGERAVEGTCTFGPAPDDQNNGANATMTTPVVDDETFIQLKDAVQRFVTERLVPNEMRLELEDEVPEEIVAEMRELGLFGLTIPPEYGGIGLNAQQETQLAMIFGSTALAFRSLLATNIGIGARGLIFEGTEEQKQAYLPKMAIGELISAFALTEPDTGSDPANLTTRAVRDGDDYLITGTKRYITNAERAGLFTVMARTEFDKPGADTISAFLVPRNVPGLTIGKKDRKMGQRGTTTSDVMFDNVRVPASAIIGLVPGRGFRLAMRVLDRGRIHIAALATGACQRLIAEMVGFARERRQFGKPIAEYQLIQAMIADSHTEYLAAKALVEQTAAIYDRDGAARTEASAAKYFATEAVGRVADRAVQVHGGAGYMNEYAVERFYRDVRLLRIYEGTSQIQQLLIARQVLKGA